MALLKVAVDTPQYSGLDGVLDYEGPVLSPGTLIRVPLGRREVPGVVWDCRDEPLQPLPEGVRAITQVLDALPPLA